MGPDTILPRHCPDQMDINRVASRVLDELVKPMRDVGLDEQEFACMKAIVFFDPGEPFDIIEILWRHLQGVWVINGNFMTY